MTLRHHLYCTYQLSSIQGGNTAHPGCLDEDIAAGHGLDSSPVKATRQPVLTYAASPWASMQGIIQTIADDVRASDKHGLSCWAAKYVAQMNSVAYLDNDSEEATHPGRTGPSKPKKSPR